jgi:phage terminase large subunit-like protein
MSHAEQYARWVLDPANERETGRLIKLAAQRFLNDLQRTDIYFDEREAVKMWSFAERHCYQWEGDWRGKLLMFEPWQRFIFEQVYGWYKTESRTRRVTEVYIQVAKKNGKSTMCAGLMNFHLCADERVNTPKIFTAANNEDQAKICVNMAGRIIEQSEDLYSFVEDGQVALFNYKDNITEVVHKEKDGFIKAFAKETSDKKSKTAGGKHGVNASLGVVDEFGMSPDHGASKPIKTSMASRREGLMFYITTAGFNMSGPCYQELRKVGIEVLEGTIIKDNYLPIIFEMDEGDDWKDEKNWKKCNPNLDISVNREFLKEMVSDAITYGGTTEVDVKTLNFNMWVDSPAVFVSSEEWNKNSYGTTIESLAGETCYGGLEVGPSGEISALCLMFPGEPLKVKMTFFLAEEALKKTETYLKNRDLIRIDPGNEVENDVAIQWIIEEFEKYQLHSFCFPVTQKNNSIVQGLIKAGYQGNPISQGLNGISDATTEWEKMLRAGQIEHFNNPILAWMNSNCLAVRKETGTRIEKNPKVLGIYACLNALAQMKTIEADEITGDELIESW